MSTGKFHAGNFANAYLKVPIAQVWDFDLLDSNEFFYHEVSIGRGLEGWKKMFTFLTDGRDMGHFVFATAWAVYTSKLLPHAQCALANCYRMRSVR